MNTSTPLWWYSVKTINSRKKSEYAVHRLAFNEKMYILTTCKRDIINTSLPDQYISQVGDIQPGHSIKGKQIWLSKDRDVEEMYDESSIEGKSVQGKSEVVLWCYRNETNHSSVEEPPNNKRPSSSGDVMSSSSTVFGLGVLIICPMITRSKQS